LEWKKEEENDYQTVIGSEAAPILSLTYTQTSGIEAGQVYLIRVRALNAMGWGHFSTPLAIVAAEVPAKPDPPLTTIDNVNVRVSWTKPYQNSSPITAYEIMI